jgi:multisubunit Na+/H+ antiporter MnhC subunit
MRALALCMALVFTSSGCVAVGAISGAALGAVTPVLIAAEKSSRYPEPVYASDRAVILTSIVGAGIGALIGWLVVTDNKPKKEESPDE